MYVVIVDISAQHSLHSKTHPHAVEGGIGRGISHRPVWGPTLSPRGVARVATRR